jgi:pimeloyl-ACP methyl ester carboxylesterase
VVNLRAQPHAQVQISRSTTGVSARPASDEELHRYWPQLTKLWPAYQDFYNNGGKRSVFVLQPDGPVLIIHAADDPATPYDAAQQAAGRIPRARLLRVGKGGHLMLGQQETVGPELAAFLETPVPPETRPAQASKPGSA